ncbi:hypothetical protein VTO42DRAFT_8758 [Malbranchea cinnamomea]
MIMRFRPRRSSSLSILTHVGRRLAQARLLSMVCPQAGRLHAISHPAVKSMGRASIAWSACGRAYDCGQEGCSLWKMHQSARGSEYTTN